MVTIITMAYLRSLLSLSQHPKSIPTSTTAPAFAAAAPQVRTIRPVCPRAVNALAEPHPYLHGVLIVCWGPEVHFSFVFKAGIISWAVPGRRVPLGLPGERQTDKSTTLSLPLSSLTSAIKLQPQNSHRTCYHTHLVTTW